MDKNNNSLPDANWLALNAPLIAMQYTRLKGNPIVTERNRIVTLTLTPLLSLLAGILILMVPRLLNYVVAIYLILTGLIGIFDINLQL